MTVSSEINQPERVFSKLLSVLRVILSLVGMSSLDFLKLKGPTNLLGKRDAFSYAQRDKFFINIFIKCF